MQSLATTISTRTKERNVQLASKSFNFHLKERDKSIIGNTHIT